MKILKSELENLKFQVNKEKKRNNILQDKLIQIESQSRRDNLLIDGIPESDRESWAECEKRWRIFLNTKRRFKMGITSGLWGAITLAPTLYKAKNYYIQAALGLSTERSYGVTRVS